VSNAARATRPGDPLTPRITTEAGRAVLTVADRGVGMPPEVLARLGEPFFTTRGDRGSGLGVGICMRIVEEHGGTLTFRSTVGDGTTATVGLPLLAEAGTP
jgi:signal transduction histidine kinase